MIVRFGTGWRDARGRERALIYLGEPGWLLWDDGYNIDLIRRGLYDPLAVHARLAGWQYHVNDPVGPTWVVDRVNCWAPPTDGPPDPDCPICQGEGWYADPIDEGIAQRCGCSPGDPF